MVVIILFKLNLGLTLMLHKISHKQKITTKGVQQQKNTKLKIKGNMILLRCFTFNTCSVYFIFSFLQH